MSGDREIRAIERQSCAALDRVLAECVRQRTELGTKKYGQVLDDNPQPQAARDIHALQEMIDGVQYLYWAGRESFAYRLAELANELRAETGLSAAEIMAGGKV